MRHRRWQHISARFSTAAALVGQLVEAQRELFGGGGQGTALAATLGWPVLLTSLVDLLSRVLARWSRVKLILIDEPGYVPLAEVHAELLFQVHRLPGRKGSRNRHHQPALLRVAPGLHQRKTLQAVRDRLSVQPHIIETGSESYRFRRTLQTKTKD